MSPTDIYTMETRKQLRRKDNSETGQLDFVTKLGAAKHALALATELPDITELIDHGEAVRAAARSLHITAPGVNAWTRFVVDAERKGWKRIEAMREAGELAKRGRPGKSAEIAGLSDLIERRPTERASEWSLLSKLTEFQLNELERIANEEDRVLTRSELLKLAKAGMPESSKVKEPKDRSQKELEIIDQAQRIVAEQCGVEGIKVEDNAKIINDEDDRGWWVEAWVFVEDELSRSDLDAD